MGQNKAKPDTGPGTLQQSHALETARIGTDALQYFEEVNAHSIMSLTSRRHGLVYAWSTLAIHAALLQYMQHSSIHTALLNTRSTLTIHAALLQCMQHSSRRAALLQYIRMQHSSIHGPLSNLQYMDHSWCISWCI